MQETEHKTYQSVIRTRIIAVVAIVSVLMASIFADILIGPAFLGVAEVFSALLGVDGDHAGMTYVIVHEIRLPMTLMAILVGAALGIAGTLMQTILNNPLASPYTLGFSAAAGFGAASVILIGFDFSTLRGVAVPLAAFAMTLAATLMVYGFSRIRGMTTEVMVLSGIATLFLFQSLQSLVQYMASPEVLQEIVFWLFGSMLKATWMSVSVLSGILLVSIVLITPDVWKLTALRLGDDRAQSLGVNLKVFRIKMLIIVSFLTAGAVAFVGTIGFVGLVAPHVARILVGEDQRFLLPASAIVGSLLMCAASVASKLVYPGAVVPIGIVTALVGVPFLFSLILRVRRVIW